MQGSGVSRPQQTSERTTAIEENEDDCGAGQCDQGQCREIGDQVEIESHETKADERHVALSRLRGFDPPRTAPPEPL